MTDTQNQPNFNIGSIYLKDCSFEAPKPISAYSSKGWNPNADVDIQVNTSTLSENVHEVVLCATLKVTVEDQTVFIVEMQQAGSFNISGIEGEKLNQILKAYCASIVFPYLRQNVSDTISRAGFPPLYLSPIDFDAQYMASKKQEAETTTAN